MRRRTLIRVAITIFALAGLGVTESALARGNARCDTQVASPGLLLRDVPNAVRDLLPLPLYGVPQLFVSKPHFTKNGSELYSGLAVWKGSDEELVARGTERKTGQHGTFIIERGAALRGLQYVPATLPIHGCWSFLLKTKSAEIVIQMKV